MGNIRNKLLILFPRSDKLAVVCVSDHEYPPRVSPTTCTDVDGKSWPVASSTWNTIRPGTVLGDTLPLTMARSYTPMVSVRGRRSVVIAYFRLKFEFRMDVFSQEAFKTLTEKEKIQGTRDEIGKGRHRKEEGT